MLCIVENVEHNSMEIFARIAENPQKLCKKLTSLFYSSGTAKNR